MAPRAMEDTVQSAPSRILVYKTASWVYLVGSYKAEEAWRVLKLSRREVGLVVEQDSTTYTRAQITQLLRTLRDGNQATGGLQSVCRAYALAGCFSFLEGFYLLFVLKRSKLGVLAGHKMFGIEQTALLPLLHPSVAREAFQDAQNALDEARYRRIFGGIALDSTFFYSPTWPLWRTVQSVFTDVNDEHDPYASPWVWNGHVSRPLRALGHGAWVTPLVHGCCVQRQLSLFGRTLSLTLIARRSRHFAGTRFRKRGINTDGFVANEMEIEQVVDAGHDVRSRRPLLSSWVQLRGSIPLFWGQTSDGGIVKPAIVVQQFDPLYAATELHFSRLRERYGEAIVVLDLVRNSGREAILGKAYRAAIAALNDHADAERPFSGSTSASVPPHGGVGAQDSRSCATAGAAPARAPFVGDGVGLPAPEAGVPIRYIAWDLQAVARSKPRSVLRLLRQLALPALDATGMFVSVAPCDDEREGPLPSAPGTPQPPFRRQHGVIRSNCIDCLDRTNLAQFCLGLCTLARQLAALGLSPSPRALAPDSSAALMLMDEYEVVGHAAAQQYGGSEAHAAFFQRARGGWAAATHSRDLLTSLRRIYSNAYTDADKQDSINLLLGVFQPKIGMPALWELGGDAALHRAAAGGAAAGAGPGRGGRWRGVLFGSGLFAPLAPGSVEADRPAPAGRPGLMSLTEAAAAAGAALPVTRPLGVPADSDSDDDSSLASTRSLEGEGGGTLSLRRIVQMGLGAEDSTTSVSGVPSLMMPEVPGARGELLECGPDDDETRGVPRALDEPGPATPPAPGSPPGPPVSPWTPRHRRPHKLESFDELFRAPCMTLHPVRIVSSACEGADPSSAAGRSTPPPPFRGPSRQMSSPGLILSLPSWLSPGRPSSGQELVWDDDDGQGGSWPPGSRPVSSVLDSPSFSSRASLARRTGSISARSSPPPLGGGAARQPRSSSADAARRPVEGAGTPGTRSLASLADAMLVSLSNLADGAAPRISRALRRGRTVPESSWAAGLQLEDLDARAGAGPLRRRSTPAEGPASHAAPPDVESASPTKHEEGVVETAAQQLWDAMWNQRAESVSRVAGPAVAPGSERLPLDLGDVLWGAEAFRHGLNTLGVPPAEAAWWSGDPLDSLLGAAGGLRASVVQDGEQWTVPDPTSNMAPVSPFSAI